MKAIRFEQFGEPAEVLKVVDLPEPEPGPNEVRVRMIASPINPSDLLVVRGRYGVLPGLPATPGFEGVGVVEKAGPGVFGKLLMGRRVAVLNQAGGNWAEKVVVPALRAIPAASDLPDEQVASFFVNPASVLAMVRHILKVPRGAWLLQSAAGSTLGKMVIKLGKVDGFKTLNVVRRREAMAELKALGADAVISSSDGPIDEQVRSLTGKGVHYALDPVGGETGGQVFKSLGDDAHMLVYGLLSDEPICFDPRAMIAGKRVIEGFWLGHWMQARSKLKAVMLFREITKMIREGILATEPGLAFQLDAIHEAVVEAERVGRKGKPLLKMG
ncbi:MAG TPA: zinc-dependent alcohol dehydrogenase family protein [Isosphaeraceae bacterium]